MVKRAPHAMPPWGVLFLYNKVKFPWAVHIREAKCTCGEATFLILKEEMINSGSNKTKYNSTNSRKQKGNKCPLPATCFMFDC